MMERIRNLALRARQRARWILEHRTKLAGSLGVALGYVQANQSQLHIFLPAIVERFSLIVVGTLVFFIGAYNTWVLARGKDIQPPQP